MHTPIFWSVVISQDVTLHIMWVQYSHSGSAWLSRTYLTSRYLVAMRSIHLTESVFILSYKRIYESFSYILT